MKTSWRGLSSSSSKDVFKTSSRCLDEDEYILINHTSSEDVLKTSWSRPIYSSCPYVFKTFSRCLQDFLPKRLQDVFKTSSRRLQDVFKTSSRRLQDILPRRLKDVFKRSSRRLANTSWGHLQDVLKTYHVSSSETSFISKPLRGIEHVCKTYWKDCCLQKDSPRSHFWEIYSKCTKFARVIKISQVLVFQFYYTF